MSDHTTHAFGPIAASTRSMRAAKRPPSGPSLVPSEMITVLGCTTFSAARRANRPCGVVRPLLASQAMSAPSSRPPSDGRRPTASESPTTSTSADASAAVIRANAAAGRITQNSRAASNAVDRRGRGIEFPYRQDALASGELLYGRLQVRPERRREDRGEMIDVLE